MPAARTRGRRVANLLGCHIQEHALNSIHAGSPIHPMQLTEHRDENHLFVRKASAEAVVIVDREFRNSLVVNPTRVLDDFPVASVDGFDRGAIDQILELQPEVVLLGTGERAVFPPASVLGAFLQRGVGLETMDNAAAARTFNVLVSEGRNVVAVFLLQN
jgi:uncharacterized protein